MDSIKAYILHHPTRVKYGLIIVNVFIILISVRMYINYTVIENTIQDTITQTQQQTLALNFSQNFLLNYEQSEYAQYFLQHDNNILGPSEFIIKFEQMPVQVQNPVNTNPVSPYDQQTYITTPQESRNHFIMDKMSKIR